MTRAKPAWDLARSFNIASQGVRRMKTVLVLAVVLAAANAFAQTSSVPDGLGIYFETTALTNSKECAGGSIVTAYLVATHISQKNGMAVWECEVVLGGDVSMDDVSWTYSNPDAVVNALAPPQFMVAMAPPLPAAPSMYLLRIRFPFPKAGTPVLLGIGPSTPTSLPGQHTAAYGNGDSSVLTPFTPSSTAFPVPGRPGFYYVACAGGRGPALD
jgi:hypothetical protein